MSIDISANIQEEINSHCQTAYPHECCGALIGNSPDGAKSVSSVVALTNSEPNSPERRFVIGPAELNALDRKCRANGTQILGFYHSHPDSPARPSSTDLEWAWPEYSYVIVSVEKGEIADFRSYILDESSGFASFVEEPIAGSL